MSIHGGSGGPGGSPLLCAAAKEVYPKPGTLEFVIACSPDEVAELRRRWDQMLTDVLYGKFTPPASDEPS